MKKSKVKDSYDKSMEDLPKPPYATEKEWREEKELLKDRYRLRDKSLEGKKLTLKERQRSEKNTKRLWELADKSTKRWEKAQAELAKRASEDSTKIDRSGGID